MQLNELTLICDKLNKLSTDINNLKQLNETLSELIENITINEMAEKQGFDAQFLYYTLDNEYQSHYPHLHLCVAKDNKKWDGKPLRSGNPYKSVASVRLTRLDGYTPENLIFEEIKDERVNTNKFKKIICDWLNSNFNGKRYLKQTNAEKCINSYLINNENGYFNSEAEKLLDGEINEIQ